MDSQPIFFGPIEGVQAVTEERRSRALLLPDALRAAGPVKHAPMPNAAAACEKNRCHFERVVFGCRTSYPSGSFFGGACPVPIRR